MSKSGLKIADFGMSHALQSDTYDAADDTQFPVRWSRFASLFLEYLLNVSALK